MGHCMGIAKRGNANELGDVGESFLFFIRMSTTPRIELSEDRGIASVKHHPSCGVRNALIGPWNSEAGSIIFVSVRTHICIRSPR